MNLFYIADNGRVPTIEYIIWVSFIIILVLMFYYTLKIYIKNEFSNP